MAVIDLLMPKLGESIMEATILKWHKKEGDIIKQDETLLEIATDKVDSEIPSTTEGTITSILFKENDVVPIGTPIARIETEEVERKEKPAERNEGVGDEPDAADAVIPYAPQQHNFKIESNGGNRFYSPLVLNIANNEGIHVGELEKIPGSGSEGRVTKKDILQYIENKKSGKLQDVSNKGADKRKFVETKTSPEAINKGVEQKEERDQPVTAINEVEAGQGGFQDNVEIIEMDRMRKLIAKHMVESKRTSPHVTSFAEADVTNMVLWRETVKKDFEKRENTKITFTPLFIDCLVRVIRRFPIINSSVDNDKIIIKKDINIGMATAMPAGNLIVPVIKKADHLNLIGLTKMVNQLAESARNNKLKPDDTYGGTFTLTNVGTFGSLMGTPIINQPQVAILAVGAIKKRPVVIETEQGDTIGIRHMMYLSLSYDHRIVDGSIGASFLSAVAKEFENWDRLRNL